MAGPEAELHLYGADVRSLGELVASLPDPSALAALEALNLHAGRVSRIDGEALAPLAPRLTSLNLSSNELTSMAGVGALVSLTALDLSSNRIRRIEGLSALPRLAVARLAHNAIELLSGLASLRAGPLRELDLRGNSVDALHELEFLDGLDALEVRPNAGPRRAARPTAPPPGPGRMLASSRAAWALL